MAISAGDRIPDVEIKTLGPDGSPQALQSGEALGTGRVVLFAVPGAFTPGCSKIHLPGFVEKAAALSDKGVDTVACIATNDAFVMGAWGEAQGVGDDILMLADGNAAFTEAMGLTFDLTGAGLGVRSRRYAAIIDDGVITDLAVEEAGGIDVSSCDTVLSKL